MVFLAVIGKVVSAVVKAVVKAVKAVAKAVQKIVKKTGKIAVNTTKTLAKESANQMVKTSGGETQSKQSSRNAMSIDQMRNIGYGGLQPQQALNTANQDITHLSQNFQYSKMAISNAQSSKQGMRMG